MKKERIIVNADGSLKLPGLFQNLIKNPADIVYIRIDNQTSYIYFKNGECWQKGLGLVDFELALGDEMFCRVHDTFLVNLSCEKSHRRNKRGMTVVLENKKQTEAGYRFEQEIPVSYRKKDDFKAASDRYKSNK